MQPRSSSLAGLPASSLDLWLFDAEIRQLVPPRQRRLAVVLRILGGTITCQSQKGIGTVFVVTLTFRRQQGTQKHFDPSSGRVVDVAAPEAGPKPLGEKPFAGRKALLVDDSKLNLTVSRHYLVAMGLEVETATDGSQAFELVRKNGPGYYFVIMMDI